MLNILSPRPTSRLHRKAGPIWRSITTARSWCIANLDSLNSYDQPPPSMRGGRVTPHVVLFVRDLSRRCRRRRWSQFVGMPFVRAGSQASTKCAAASKSLCQQARVVHRRTANYEWVEFDDSACSTVLFGGHSHGATVSGPVHAQRPEHGDGRLRCPARQRRRRASHVRHA